MSAERHWMFKEGFQRALQRNPQPRICIHVILQTHET